MLLEGATILYTSMEILQFFLYIPTFLIWLCDLLLNARLVLI